MCNDLEIYYDLKPSRIINVIAKVTLFLYIIVVKGVRLEGAGEISIFR